MGSLGVSDLMKQALDCTRNASQLTSCAADSTSTVNTDGTDSTSTDRSTCGTRLMMMMMMARRGEGREIEEGRDGKEKREREPETKRKGASAKIGRSIRPLPIHGYLIFGSYLLCQASSFGLYCPSGHSSHCSRAFAMERPRIRGVTWNEQR